MTEGGDNVTETTNVTGRVWFVTGASRGFGRAVCEEVLANGDTVVATARNPGALRPFDAAADGRVAVLSLDVADAKEARAAARDAVDRYGRVDVVFNNAGFASIGAAEELTDRELREQLDVNLLGVINVTRAVLPYMRKQGFGHLLQMSSLNGVEGLPGGSYYAASKFGVEGFSDSLADEVAPLGIRVTIVEPGPHRTGLLGEQSVKRSREIEAYARTVGPVRDQLHDLNGNQPGDPARAARALIRVVESDDPPRHLPLGQMAIDHIRTRLRLRLDELDQIAGLAATSDFPDAEAAR